MQGSKGLRRHLESGSCAAGMVGSGRGKQWHGQLIGPGRKGNILTGGAHESEVRKRRGGLAKCGTPRRKRSPTITPRCYGPTGLAMEAAVCGWRVGRCKRTRPARPNPRGDSNGNLIFFNFKYIWNLVRL
jgi:hypothetical protein